MTDQNLKSLKVLLAAMSEDHLGKEDFVAEFEKVVALVKQIEQQNIQEFEQIHSTLATFAKKIESDTNTNFDVLKSQLCQDMDKKMAEMMKQHEAKMCAMDNKMMEVKDGEDADPEMIIERLKSEMNIPSIDDLKNELPVAGEQIRNALELLQGEERLDSSAIKGLDKLITPGGEVRMIGGARGIQLQIGGVKQGLVNSLNLVAGAGVSFNYNRSGGRNDLTISASGAALAILAATGAVDDSNTTFTFTSTPVLVVVNGATYRDGHGCAITGNSVVLDNAVGVGGDIYAIG